VDKMFVLNQTPEEKINGIMRIGSIADRHEGFASNKEVMLLQSLEIGQPFLDQQIYAGKKEDDEK
jgi:hypothetical protein